jgi:hypothetical protein
VVAAVAVAVRARLYAYIRAAAMVSLLRALAFRTDVSAAFDKRGAAASPPPLPLFSLLDEMVAGLTVNLLWSLEKLGIDRALKATAAGLFAAGLFGGTALPADAPEKAVKVLVGAFADVVGCWIASVFAAAVAGMAMVVERVAALPAIFLLRASCRISVAVLGLGTMAGRPRAFGAAAAVLCRGRGRAADCDEEVDDEEDEEEDDEATAAARGAGASSVSRTAAS